MAKPTTLIHHNLLNVINDSLDQIDRLRQWLKTVGTLDGIPAALELLDQLEAAVADVGFETEMAQDEGVGR